MAGKPNYLTFAATHNYNAQVKYYQEWVNAMAIRCRFDLIPESLKGKDLVNEAEHKLMQVRLNEFEKFLNSEHASKVCKQDYSALKASLNISSIGYSTLALLPLGAGVQITLGIISIAASIASNTIGEPEQYPIPEMPLILPLSIIDKSPQEIEQFPQVIKKLGYAGIEGFDAFKSGSWGYRILYDSKGSPSMAMLPKSQQTGAEAAVIDIGYIFKKNPTIVDRAGAAIKLTGAILEHEDEPIRAINNFFPWFVEAYDKLLPSGSDWKTFDQVIEHLMTSEFDPSETKLVESLVLSKPENTPEMKLHIKECEEQEEKDTHAELSKLLINSEKSYLHQEDKEQSRDNDLGGKAEVKNGDQQGEYLLKSQAKVIEGEAKGMSTDKFVLYDAPTNEVAESQQTAKSTSKPEDEKIVTIQDDNQKTVTVEDWVPLDSVAVKPALAAKSSEYLIFDDSPVSKSTPTQTKQAEIPVTDDNAEGSGARSANDNDEKDAQGTEENQKTGPDDDKLDSPPQKSDPNFTETSGAEPVSVADNSECETYEYDDPTTSYTGDGSGY